LAALDGNDRCVPPIFLSTAPKKVSTLRYLACPYMAPVLARQFVQHLLDGIVSAKDIASSFFSALASTNQLRGNGLSNLTMPPAASAA